MPAYWFDAGPIPIDLCVCLSKKDFRRAVKASGITDAGEFIPMTYSAAVVRFVRVEGPVYVFANFSPKTLAKLTPQQVVGVVAHEATHVMQHCRDAMRDDAMSRETEAYIVGWSAQCMLQVINEALADGP